MSVEGDWHLGPSKSREFLLEKKGSAGDNEHVRNLRASGGAVSAIQQHALHRVCWADSIVELAAKVAIRVCSTLLPTKR